MSNLDHVLRGKSLHFLLQTLSPNFTFPFLTTSLSLKRLTMVDFEGLVSRLLVLLIVASAASNIFLLAAILTTNSRLAFSVASCSAAAPFLLPPLQPPLALQPPFLPYWQQLLAWLAHNFLPHSLFSGLFCSFLVRLAASSLAFSAASRPA
jgi:hypothetical protein